MNLSRSMWYYQSRKDDREVIDKLSELAELLPTRGFDEYYERIRQQGYKWNRKRVLRIYRLMKLGLRRKHKKRLPARVKQPLVQPDEYLHTWSMDFMSDALADKRKIRIFNVIDDYNREALAIEPILIDTVFKVGPDSLFVHFEHYCLKDSEFIVPASSYEIAGDFKTYNFASKLEVSSHTEVIHKEVIRKETFDDLLFERLRNYGVLMMPSIALVSENDKDLIRVHYSITIPGTDVGTSATLYLSRLGERRISQY